MKNLLPFLLACTLAACAAKAPAPNYSEERNPGRSASSRAFAEAPEDVLRAAQAVLEDLTRESNPPASGAVKGDDGTVYIGWVYGITKGGEGVKPQPMRRIFGYTVTPAPGTGSRITLNAEQEVQEIDSLTGEPGPWTRVPTPPGIYELMLRRIREKIRSLAH